MKKIFLSVMLMQAMVAYAHDPLKINQLSLEPDSCPAGLRDRVSFGLQKSNQKGYARSMKALLGHCKVPLAVGASLFTGIQIGQFNMIYHLFKRQDEKDRTKYVHHANLSGYAMKSWAAWWYFKLHPHSKAKSHYIKY